MYLIASIEIFNFCTIIYTKGYKMAFSSETKKILSTAYMQLYKALVSQYQSHGQILGQSQYNAMRDMREFIAARIDNINTPAIAFLARLFNTHKPIVERQSMQSPHKGDMANPDAPYDTNAVAFAIKNLEEKISVVNSNPFVAETTDTARNYVSQVLKRKGKSRLTFKKWLEFDATPTDRNKLANDPSYFETLHKKFVMRQKQ